MPRPEISIALALPTEIISASAIAATAAAAAGGAAAAVNNALCDANRADDEEGANHLRSHGDCWDAATKHFFRKELCPFFDVVVIDVQKNKMVRLYVHVSP